MTRKNIRKIPENIIRKIDNFRNKNVVIECVLQIPKEDIENGVYSQRGINLVNGELSLIKNFVPLAKTGRFSKKNVLGYEVVHTDWPKIEKTWFIETPNFGDWDKGSHTIVITKMVAPHEFISPKFVTISLELLAFDQEKNRYVIKFTVDETLDKNDKKFLNGLFFNLNLLLEFIGHIDVYESTTTKDEFLKTLYVNWEILPVGEGDAKYQKIIGNTNGLDKKAIEEIIERYKFIYSLNPKKEIYGFSGFARYYGALFKDNLVVLENNRYGNASYVMFDDWEQLSKRSRYELLHTNGANFIRVLHNSNWKDKISKIIKYYLKQK